MTKQDFQQQQREAMKTRYAELRSQKTRRPAALAIMSPEFGLSAATISEIMNTNRYYNRSKKQNA